MQTTSCWRRRGKFAFLSLNFEYNFISSCLLIYIFLLQSDEGWEEVFDFVFPEDELQKPNLKLFASVKNWKKQQDQEESQKENQQTETQTN